jgi:uncharacterized membrane protein
MAGPKRPDGHYPIYYRYISHYLPLWLAVLLVIVPILLGNLLPGSEAHQGRRPRWTADVVLGLLSFWLWAMVTNAHDNRLVRSSGQLQATDKKERSLEFAAILFFAFLTVISYLVCLQDIAAEFVYMALAVNLTFPIIVLGVPE